VVGAGAPGGALHVLGGPGAANDAWWTLKRALLPRQLRRIASSEPVAIGAAVWAARSSTGMSPALPSSAPTDDGPERLPGEQPSALLADFIAAATAAHETARQPASEAPTYH
jgi:xylulokinase